MKFNLYLLQLIYDDKPEHNYVGVYPSLPDLLGVVGDFDDGMNDKFPYSAAELEKKLQTIDVITYHYPDGEVVAISEASPYSLESILNAAKSAEHLIYA